MSGSSNILQFDNTAFNMLSDAAYAASSQLANGFSSGIAPSAAMNKVLYQVSTMAYALGQVMANRGQTIVDTNPSGLITAISESFGPVTGVQAKSGAYTAVSTDYGNLLVCTGNWSLSLTAAATLGSGWCVFVRNDGTGVITVDPNGAELINGASTLVLLPGATCMIICDGTGFKTVGLPGFSEQYTSSDQTITAAGLLTLAHGLGVAPKEMRFTLICQTGEQGYTAGDEVELSGFGMGSVGAGNLGITAVADATNITIRFGSAASTMAVLNKTTGVAVQLTNANWKLRVRAFA